MPSSHTPDALVVAFDDDHAVANAGLALTATLAERLGVEAVVDELVDLGDRPGHHRPGRKVLTCCTRWWSAATRSTTPRSCGPGAPRRCSGIG
jgi:hypothetical protein